MATKKLIVHILWIIQVYEIPRAKVPKQNCLGQVFRERVGIIPKLYSLPIVADSGFSLSAIILFAHFDFFHFQSFFNVTMYNDVS